MTTQLTVTPLDQNPAPGTAPSFNVTDVEYGAVGDGVSDDTAALAAALLAGTGKHVILPPGQYKVISQLVVPDYTTLELRPGSKIHVHTTGGGDAIHVGNGASLVGYGKGEGAAQIIVKSGASIANVVRNTNVDGTAEDCYVEGLYITAEAGATISGAGVKLEGMFVNAGVKDCKVIGEDIFTNGFIIRGGAGPTLAGAAPVYLERCTVVSTLQHGIVIDDADDPALGWVEVWLTNITAENPGSGYHAVHISGAATATESGDVSVKHVSIKNLHHENHRVLAGPSISYAVYIDAPSCPFMEIDGVALGCAETSYKGGIYIGATTNSDKIAIRNVLSPYNITVLKDDYKGVTRTNRHIGQYGGDFDVPAARVYNNANITGIVTATWTALTFNQEKYDTDTIHDTSSNTSRLTCKTAGVYDIFGHIEWDSDGTGTYREIGIFLNSTSFIAIDTKPVLGTTKHSISTEYKLAVGDYVELVVRQDSGTNRTITAENPDYSPHFGMSRKAAG